MSAINIAYESSDSTSNAIIELKSYKLVVTARWILFTPGDGTVLQEII